MTSDLATYITVGTQALSSGLGGLFTNNAIKKENQKNRDWNEKMWHLANEYNSPANQRKLYESAGLNPALLYQSGTSALSSYAGNLSTSENFKNPLEGLNVSEAIALNMQRKQTESNISLQDSQQQVNEAQQKDLEASALNKNAETSLKNLQSQLLSGQMSSLIEQSKVDLENAKKHGLIQEKDYQIRLEQLKQQEEIYRKLKADADTAEEITKTQREQTKLVTVQIDSARSAAEANRASAEASRAAAYKALQEGKTEEYTRMMIVSNLAVNEATITKLHNDASLSWEQAQKCIAEVAKMESEKKKIDWELIRDMYGTNTATILHNDLRYITQKVKTHNENLKKKVKNVFKFPTRKKNYPGGSW